MKRSLRPRPPNLFLVGAPKAGTTALYRYLQAHPEVFLPRAKEPHFFDRPKADLARGLGDYLALFEGATAAQAVVGEGSTGYLSSPHALENIGETCPDARIVVMLRNPVELVQALHAEMCWRLFEDRPDFATAWSLQAARSRGERLPETNPWGIAPRMLQYEEVARLGQQVSRLLDVFPRDRVQLILFDDFVRSPGAVYASALEFLALTHDGRSSFPVVNPRRVLRWPGLARRLGRPPRVATSAARQLKRWLGAESVELLRPLRRALERTRGPEAQPLSADLREHLVETFRPEVARLEELLGRDLGHWCESTSDTGSGGRSPE